MYYQIWSTIPYVYKEGSFIKDDPLVKLGNTENLLIWKLESSADTKDE